MKHILLLFLFAGTMIAQTHNGRKIVIKNNGTWEYAESETPIANGDCTYEKNEKDEFDGFFISIYRHQALFQQRFSR